MEIRYIMSKVTIDRNTISKFYINEADRRKVKEGKVKDLLNSLRAGLHFAAPLVANEESSTGKLRLLDGNHRYEAIKQILKEDKEFKIVVWIAVYRDLSSEEEKEIYRVWNIGNPQSTTDFLKAYFNTIPLKRELLTLPVSIYGDKDKMPMRYFVGCQISAKKHNYFEGGYSASKEVTIDDFRDLTNEDIAYLRSFYRFMTTCFGSYQKGSQFYQTTPLSVFYRIWFDNQHIDNRRLENSFKKVFGQNPQKWSDWTKSGGRSAAKTFYSVAITALNRVHKSLQFKTDEEAVNEFRKVDNFLSSIKPK
jgi:hypothetical protein